MAPGRFVVVCGQKGVCDCVESLQFSELVGLTLLDVIDPNRLKCFP